MNETGNSNALGRFLTLADVAEVLNISTGAAYSLVRSGELPAIKLGRHGQWRIERDVLESYIEAKYEEARRIKAWREAEFDRVVEPVFGAGPVFGGAADATGRGGATGGAGVTGTAEERPLHGLPPHRDPPRGPGDRGA